MRLQEEMRMKMDSETIIWIREDYRKTGEYKMDTWRLQGDEEMRLKIDAETIIWRRRLPKEMRRIENGYTEATRNKRQTH